MWYKFVQTICMIFFKICFRLEVIGRENIPSTGPLVIAANHISLLDPPLVGTCSTRAVRFMAKEELFVFPMGQIYRSLGAFAVKRGASDRNAIKTALGILKNGGVLGIFPEGTRSKDGKLGQAEPGALAIASKAGAIVIPTAVLGSKLQGRKSFWPKMKVVFGKPMDFSAGQLHKEELEEKGRELMKNIENLLEEHKI